MWYQIGCDDMDLREVHDSIQYEWAQYELDKTRDDGLIHIMGLSFESDDDIIMLWKRWPRVWYNHGFIFLAHLVAEQLDIPDWYVREEAEPVSELDTVHECFALYYAVDLLTNDLDLRRKIQELIIGYLKQIENGGIIL